MPETIQDLPGEIWKPVVGHEERYEVSDLGRVRARAKRVRSRHGFRNVREKLLAPISNHGYLLACLYKNGAKYPRRIHVLVLEAFVGPRPEGMQGCHDDDCRSHNVLSNLRWATPKSNMADRERHGKTVRGSLSPAAKLNEVKVTEIKQFYASGAYTHKDLGRKFGVSRHTVMRVVYGKSWRHVLEDKTKTMKGSK